MEPNKKISVKDFFLNIGATVSLYVAVVTLITLLFTVIDVAFPKIVNSYLGSSSISWSVAVLLVSTPILITLMWLLEKQYITEPERKDVGIHKWLTYLTLFLSGFAVAGDLVSVIYYFIDGQELSTGFMLKCAALLVVAGSLFGYYLSDIRGKLSHSGRVTWRVVSVLIVIASIVWGFSVLGSPRTQRLYKYDDTKVSDLINIDSSVVSYFTINEVLPKDFAEMSKVNYYFNITDPQLNQPYEYNVISQYKYELCANFNKATDENKSRSQTYPYMDKTWTHSAGKYCFQRSVSPQQVKIKM